MMKTSAARGQSLIEFALIFPLVLFLLLAFFDFGRGVFYYSSLSNAVREGTRAAIVNGYYLEDARTGSDLSKAVMVIDPADPNDQMCPIIADPVQAVTEDTLRCIVYRKSFGLPDDFDPTTNAIQFSIPVVDNAHTTVQITATYCFNPVVPGFQLLVDTTCNGHRGIPLTARSIMYVAPVAQ